MRGRKPGRRPRGAVPAILLFLFLLFSFCGTAKAETSYDYSGAQDVMDEALENEAPSFSDLVDAVTAGKLGELIKGIPGWLKDSLFSEIETNRMNLGQVFLIAAFGTVFSGFAASFRSRQAGEAGFYVTYLLLLSLLLGAFYETAQIAEETVGHVLDFTAALLPAFTLAVAGSGKTMTSVFSYEFIIGIISVVQWLFQTFFLPGIEIYVVLGLVNHISKEEILTKMTELLGTVLSWGIKTAVTLVVGYGAVQSMILPLADSLKTGAVTKALSAIPGIGSGAGAAASLVAGTAALIRNGIGIAALIGLVLICAVPVLKLAVITLLYYGTAAVLQPIADERVTECLSGTADGARLLLKVTTSCVGMFFLLIGVLCAFSSV